MFTKMAQTLITIKQPTTFTILILLLVSLHFERSLSFEDDGNKNEDKEYILDSGFGNTTLRSRILSSSINKIKKGTKCDMKTNPYVCNGVSANDGTSLLYCCKMHCRDVLGDWNNCGRCGHKCRLGEQRCGGVCTNVLHNERSRGKCDKKCPNGVTCEYGYCRYA